MKNFVFLFLFLFNQLHCVACYTTIANNTSNNAIVQNNNSKNICPNKNFLSNDLVNVSILATVFFGIGLGSVLLLVLLPPMYLFGVLIVFLSAISFVFSFITFLISIYLKIKLKFKKGIFLFWLNAILWFILGIVIVIANNN